MIDAGYFQVREKLYYDGEPYFSLMKDGKIIREDEDPVDIHSAIARVKNSSADRLNGWDYWAVLRDGGFVPINDIRQKYLREMKNYG